MLDWYQQNIADTGRSAALFALIGFLVTSGVTRWIMLRIRGRSSSSSESDAGAVKDVYIGGVHIHHQVWGILLVLVVGLLEFRFRPDAPWAEILAVLFGVGAALALDEFALWLHVGSIRLAKPTSYWAKRYYSETKMERSLARFDEEHQDRIERLRDFVSGGSGRATD